MIRILVITTLLLFTVVGCSRIELFPKPQKSMSVKSEGTVCAAPPDRNTRYTKFLFVIDKSGSNQQGSDPSNYYRADKIENFWNRNKDNEYVKWGYIQFGQIMGEASAYINDGNDQSPIFSGDPADMVNAIVRQREPDNGCTPYRAALALSKIAVRKDVEAHPEEDSFYMVFFMSDGMPTDYSAASGGCGIPQPAGQGALDDVDDLMNVHPGQINFSTAYYGPDNFAAAEGLRKMAEHGKGKFIDLNVSGDFEFDELIVGGPTAEPWLIKRLGVYNVNSGFCDDNTVDTDSDGDGLCDKDEIRYNTEFASNVDRWKRMNGKTFDPGNRNSFDDSYSDSFHYKRIVFGTALPLCQPTESNQDKDFDMANECEEKFLANSNPQGPTTAWTNAMLKTSDPENPDSDGDGFLDLLEFFQFKDRSTGLDYTNLTRLFDRMAGEQVMREHRHPKDPWGLPSEMVYDTVFKHVGVKEEEKNCYQVSQEFLPLYLTSNVTVEQAGGDEKLAHYPGENVVLVYYLQVPEKDPNGKGIFKYSYQRLKYRDATTKTGREAGVQFDEANFKFYKIPKLN